MRLAIHHQRPQRRQGLLLLFQKAVTQVAGHWRTDPKGGKHWVRAHVRRWLQSKHAEKVDPDWIHRIMRYASEIPDMRGKFTNTQLLARVADRRGLTWPQQKQFDKILDHIAERLYAATDLHDTMEANDKKERKLYNAQRKREEEQWKRKEEQWRREEEEKRAREKKQAEEKFSAELTAAMLDDDNDDPSAINALIGIMAEHKWLYVPTKGMNKGKVIPNTKQINEDYYNRKAREQRDAVTERAITMARRLSDTLRFYPHRWAEGLKRQASAEYRRMKLANAQEQAICQAIYDYNEKDDPTLRPFFASVGKKVNVQDLVSKHGGQAAGEILADLYGKAYGDRKTILAAQEDTTWRKPRRMTYDPIDGHKPYSFQKQGVNWMLAAKRGIVAFGMGLGKTLTAIMCAEKLRQQGVKKSIMIVPNQKVYDWANDIKGFVPNAKVVVVAGTPSQRKAAIRKAKKASTEYVVVPHSYLRNVNQAETEKLFEIDGAVFVDEAHNFAASGTRGHKNMVKLLGQRPDEDNWREYAFGLTGTPSTKYPDRYLDFVHMFTPGVLGNRNEFEARHLIKMRDKGEAIKVWKNLNKVHDDLRPFVFHKYQTDPDVKLDLPELHTNPQWWDMPRELWPYYQAAADAAFEEMAAVDNPDKLTPSEQGSILKAIHQMRAVAISPNLLLSKIKGAKPYAGPEPKLDGAATSIASHFSNPANAKTPIVVLAEWNRPFDLLRDKLIADYGFTKDDFVEISGRVSEKANQAAEKAVKAGTAKVCLLNIMKGGEGLNLQGQANAMVFLHEPWVHAKVDQALHRIWRPGQKRAVTVTTHGITNTIDGTIHSRVALKRAVADALAGRTSTSGEIEVKKTTFWDMVRLAQVPADKAREIIAKHPDSPGAKQLLKEINAGTYTGLTPPKGASRTVSANAKRINASTADIVEAVVETATKRRRATKKASTRTKRTTKRRSTRRRKSTKKAS